MSNIFISHSSKDKPFVKKLASALLSEGFPVWLDSWKLEVGDSLIDKVYDGIEASSLVLLVVSKSAVESGWVNREINAALVKEETIGRKFLIPLRVDSCEFPLKIADRLYEDFSSSFSAPFSRLVELLDKYGGRDIQPSKERELLALSFSREVHLNTSSLTKAIDCIASRQDSLSLSSEQIVINNDEVYERQLSRLHQRIDNIETDPHFSPDLESWLNYALDCVKSGEKNIRKGVALMVNNGCSSEAIYWFTKILRGQIVYKLWSAQSPNDPKNSEYGRMWQSASLGSNVSAAEFFEVSSVESVVVWQTSSRDFSFSLWVGEDEIKRIRNDEGVYEGPDILIEVCSYRNLDKYVYPQIVIRHLVNGITPVPWKLDASDVLAGIS
ncbi:toll/interleukin-1 receptor domain-containing protein [Thalassomonas actiniarum]|uniref:Toll/interleukin-1 receptor domain-containing protein n=1 Tax=Thalassomonas actiniarum TaxID=485447 RepID=A0AAF0C6U4_9GAMM|nr:toll/interleukin-1 receptor domain-containing protein [Thalassomonas actiniarum]WDE02475.1 toll/interleukin-1 receptor domain-containing protein [Thalassomonas actiniarum]